MTIWRPSEEQVADIYDAALRHELAAAEAQDICAEADEAAALYEARVAAALRESRRDFDEGRYYASREEMIAAVARMRTWSTISDLIHESGAGE